MTDYVHLLMLFVLTDLLACLTPGPAVLAVTSHALGGSIRGTIGAIAGINLGNLVWFIMAGAGLAALVSAAPTLFMLLRWFGIAYLVYLGIMTWRGGHALSFEGRQRGAGFLRGLVSAMAVQLSNPKALLFFTVFLPPFIDTRAPMLPQIAALASISVMLETSTLAGYSALAYRVGRLALSSSAAQWIGRGSGALLLAAAANLAWIGGQK